MTKSRSQSQDWASTASAVPASAVGPHPTLTDLPAPLRVALDAALEKGARAPVILMVRDVAGYTDWMMLLSGRSDRQVGAISEGITVAMKGCGVMADATDGTADHLWDLLDYDDFMIHVFYHPVRMHYDLESMWSDAPRVALGLPAELMDTTDLERLAPPEVLPGYRGAPTFGGFDDEFVEDDWSDDGNDDDDDWDAELEADAGLAADDDLPEDPALLPTEGPEGTNHPERSRGGDQPVGSAARRDVD